MTKQIIYPDIYVQAQQERAASFAQEKLKEVPLTPKEVEKPVTNGKVTEKGAK